MKRNQPLSSQPAYNRWTRHCFPLVAEPEVARVLPDLIADYHRASVYRTRYLHSLTALDSEIVSLVSSDGEVETILPFSLGKPFRQTVAGELVPKTMKLLKKLGGPLFSVRYIVSKSGASMETHFDENLSPKFGVVRLHIPLITRPESRLTIAGKSFHLATGQIYFTDVSVLHSVENAAKFDRVHLVVDIGLTKKLLTRFEGFGEMWLAADGQVTTYPSAQRPSVQRRPKSVRLKPKVTIQKVNLDPQVLPLALTRTESSEYKLRVHSRQRVDIVTHEQLRFRFEHLHDGWLFCKAIGPGFQIRVGKAQIKLVLLEKLRRDGATIRRKQVMQSVSRS